MYEYKAIVTDVYDGDTITVDIDLGLGVWVRDQKIRLYGINAPELRGDEKKAGENSKNFLIGLIQGRKVKIHTHKDKKGKYGRWLGVIVLEGHPMSVNDILVKEKYAKRVQY